MKKNCVIKKGTKKQCRYKQQFHLNKISKHLIKELSTKEIEHGQLMVNILNKYGFKFEKLLGVGGYCVVGLFKKNKIKYAIKSFHKIDNHLEKKLTYINNYIGKNFYKCKSNKKFILNVKQVKLDNTIFIISEPLDGDLFSLLFESNYKLTLNEKLLIVCQLSYGLKCVHDIKIIHGDLKPENIFCKNKTQIKIGDFDGAAVKNKTSVGIYTQSYIHPSVNIDKINEYEIEFEDDIYALGLIFIMIMDNNIADFIMDIHGQLSLVDLIDIINKIKDSILIPNELKIIIADMLNKNITMKKVYKQTKNICDKYKKTFKKYKSFKL